MLRRPLAMTELAVQGRGESWLFCLWIEICLVENRRALMGPFVLGWSGDR